MHVIHLQTGARKVVWIQLVTEEDYRIITRSNYFFNWKTEKGNPVYKQSIAGEKEIIGLMSIRHFQNEKRIEIGLLAVSKSNRGKQKTYERVAGNLIAYACREAVKLYAEEACVSLIPKDLIKLHYMKKYGMLNAGRQVFLEGLPLFSILQKYEV